MKSTRERVLQTLSSHPRSTIIEIAKEVGINAISVRHHLTSLQASSLVVSEEERHGVGRPRMVYFLTENGLEHFPTSYLRLTNNILAQLKRTISPRELNEMFKKMADQLTNEYQSSISKLNMEQKLELLRNVLAKEGFDIHWKRDGNQYEIQEMSCPFYQIGKDHPEVCVFDKSLISNILAIPIDQIQTKKIGNSLCSFIISK
jgi:DeoR family suf operon transcriptional repressor